MAEVMLQPLGTVHKWSSLWQDPLENPAHLARTRKGDAADPCADHREFMSFIRPF